VLWNIAYTGTVKCNPQGNNNIRFSDWSGLNVNIFLNTKYSASHMILFICAGQPVTLILLLKDIILITIGQGMVRLFQSGSSAALNIIAATTNDSGDYKCEVSGSAGY